MKKRIFVLLVLVTMLGIVGASTVSAESEQLYAYTVLLNGVEINGCSDSVTGDVVVPDTLDGYPVISIGNVSPLRKSA